MDRRFPDRLVMPIINPSIGGVVFAESQGGDRREQHRFVPIIDEVWFAISRRQSPDCTFDARIEEIAKKSMAAEFVSLRERWYAERGATSSITEMAMCRSYLQIIALGRSAIPLILRQMHQEGAEPDMWFVALQILTGADPVTDEIRGDFAAMAARWLDWALQNGYAW